MSYNSGGADGWLGVGWDIPIQSITVDTRWGVPRYDNGRLVADHPKETESYLLNGQELTPVFNRGALLDRAADRVFHTRVEGSFDKIVRHGTDPTNYWWEGTDKNGTRYFYGGDPDNGPDANSAVQGRQGAATGVNIYQWALREVRDLNNNAIRYHYDLVDGGGGDKAGPGTRSTSRAFATPVGPAQTDPRAFTNRLQPRRRQARYYHQRAPRLRDQAGPAPGGRGPALARPANPLIRRYAFQYRTGQFSKSLLAHVIQYGENGESGGALSQHDFDYYDDVASDTAGQLRGLQVPTASFGNASFITGGDFLTGDHSTALQAKISSSNAGGLLGRHQLPGRGRRGRQGRRPGHRQRHQAGDLLDLNGDGLLDQVYPKDTPSPDFPDCGKSFFFRPNRAGPPPTPTSAPSRSSPLSRASAPTSIPATACSATTAAPPGAWTSTATWAPSTPATRTSGPTPRAKST